MTNRIPQMASTEEEPGKLRDDVFSAIRKLTDGNPHGYDNITSEEIKATGETGINILHHLCNLIWRKEEFACDWVKAIITPIYKNKD